LFIEISDELSVCKGLVSLKKAGSPTESGLTVESWRGSSGPSEAKEVCTRKIEPIIIKTRIKVFLSISPPPLNHEHAIFNFQ